MNAMHEHTDACSPYKVCRICDEEKLSCRFYVGRHVCVPCYQENNSRTRRERTRVDEDYVEEVNAYNRSRYRKLSEEEKLTRRLSRYGLTVDKFQEMLDEQGGKCAICEEFLPRETWNGRRLHVDHDHRTGVVRGLLCMNCNLMLGHAKDRIAILMKAVEYLASSGGGSH